MGSAAESKAIARVGIATERRHEHPRRVKQRGDGRKYHAAKRHRPSTDRARLDVDLEAAEIIIGKVTAFSFSGVRAMGGAP